jgi:hypothetical protein
MTMTRTVVKFGMAVATVLLTLTNAVGAGSGGGGPIAASVLGSGSDTTMFMMAALDNLYLFSPGCAQIPTPSGPTPWLDFSCQSPDPSGTITTENYSHDQVHEAYFLGSSNGINQLCQQGTAGVANIDFARSSRGPKANHGDCAGLNFVAYATDGISVEAFDDGTTASGMHGMINQSGKCLRSGTPTTAQFCLTQSQLQAIFVSCTITNWSQVGGQNVPIVVYTAQSGSGTRSTFDGFLGGSSSNCATNAHIIPENSNAAIALADKPGVIFPFSFGNWTANVKPHLSTTANKGSKLAMIDKIAPTAGTIGAQTFPFWRYLYNVYCRQSAAGNGGCSNVTGGSSSAAISYVGENGWICKDSTDHATSPWTGNNYRTDIEAAIKAAGFVALPDGPIGNGFVGNNHCRSFSS